MDNFEKLNIICYVTISIGNTDKPKIDLRWVNYDNDAFTNEDVYEFLNEDVIPYYIKHDADSNKYTLIDEGQKDLCFDCGAYVCVHFKH